MKLRDILESILNESGKITVFHGTMPKFISSIKSNGLENKLGYSAGWYMVSTDFESALYHSRPDDDKGSTAVIEFEIEYDSEDRWVGYPYLWKGEVRNSNSTWYALKEPLPAKFIKKIHTVPYDKWIQQKNIGF